MNEPTPEWPSNDLTLDGKTWSLRPTFDALVRIEQSLGVGIVPLLYRYQSQQYGITDVTRILYEGIRAAHGNETPQFADLGEAVLRAGLPDCSTVAMDLLTDALNGLHADPEDRDELDKAAENSEADPTPPPESEQTEGRSSPGASSSAAQS